MRLPAELALQAQAWRSAFRQSPAQRIAVHLEDRHAFAAALFAAWAERKQVVLPTDVLPATVAALAAHAEAFVGSFPALPTLSPGAPSALPWAEPDLEALGLVIFTSGSTGAPAPIAKRLRQLFDEVRTLERTFGARVAPTGRVLSTVSHQHIYGLLWAVLWPLSTGRALATGRVELFALERELALGPCALIASPAHLTRLPGGPFAGNGLQAVFSSGGPLSEGAALRAAAVLGQRPIEIYGSSETGGVAWREDSGPFRPLEGVEVRRSPQGTLALRSPHLPDGAWLTTADNVALEGDGFLLQGRADRIAKVEEKRVALEQVEAAALATGLLVEARAVVLEGGRVTLGLVGTLSAQGAALPHAQRLAALKDGMRQRVEAVAVPRRFRFVEALPVDSQGKASQRALAQRFAPERPVPQWLARGPTQASLQVEISPGLRVLEGHFPGAPVVPGVAQLDWAIRWGQEAFCPAGEPSRVEALKFQAPLLPGQRAQLELGWSEATRTLTFRFAAQELTFSSGRVVFSP